MISVSRRIEAIVGFPFMARFITLKNPIAADVAKNPVPRLLNACISGPPSRYCHIARYKSY